MPLNAALRSAIMDFTSEGVIVTRRWLMNKGYSRHSIDNLVKSGQLHFLKRGVYVRGRVKVSWQSVVYSLQSMEQLDLVIGGLSALELQGLAHYLSLSGKRTIHLYGSSKLPEWFNKVIPDVQFVRHNIDDLIEPERLISENESSQLIQFTKQLDWKEDIEQLTVSAPARAFLEVLLEVAQKVSFEHADQLMQGLTNLSPRSLQKLLVLCTNVKVKRLFFWFADRYRYPWLDKIDRSTIDLGKGKRMLVKGGKLDYAYQITVPEIL